MQIIATAGGYTATDFGHKGRNLGFSYGSHEGQQRAGSFPCKFVNCDNLLDFHRSGRSHHQCTMTANRYKSHGFIKKQRFAACFLMAVFSATFGAPAASQNSITGTANVIDSDTIEIHGARIRLHAVDSIDSHQKCLLPNGKEWRCAVIPHF